MGVTTTDIKNLREKTGAGMMDCKNALLEAEGDFSKAEKILKEKGLAAAAKRSGRATNEGRIFSLIQNGKGTLVELSCETDFVARNQDFIDLGNNIAKTISDKDLTENSAELTELATHAISRIKENITIRRFKTITAEKDEFLTDYIHGVGNIGVIVKMKVDNPELISHERVNEFAFDCALHIAAFNPTFLSKDKVSVEYLKEQEEIFTKQVEELDKPDKVKAGIIKGKLIKHLAEICLHNQGFVKDEKQSVEAMATSVGKEVGGTISIVDYIYFRVGEDL